MQDLCMEHDIIHVMAISTDTLKWNVIMIKSVSLKNNVSITKSLCVLDKAL